MDADVAGCESLGTRCSSILDPKATFVTTSQTSKRDGSGLGSTCKIIYWYKYTNA